MERRENMFMNKVVIGDRCKDVYQTRGSVGNTCLVLGALLDNTHQHQRNILIEPIEPIT